MKSNRCTKCFVLKPNDQFYKRGLGGLRRSQCIECTIEYERARGTNYFRQYHDKNKVRIHERKRVARLSVEKRAVEVLGQARRRSQAGNLEFDIILPFVEVLLRIGICQKSGIRFDLDKHHKLRINPLAPSLDRKDSFRGYTMDNVQLVCDMYNRGKGQNTDADFVAFCKAVAEHHK